MDDLTLLDVWRALDFVVRLLARLGDAAGSSEAKNLRNSIMRLNAPGTETDSSDYADDEADKSDDDQDVTPEPEDYEREKERGGEPKTGLPNERLEY